MPLFGALTNLTFEDAVALIDFRWKVAGGDKHPFDRGALEAIFKYSKGLPRKISKIADNALIRAMVRDHRVNLFKINGLIFDILP